MPCMNYLNSFKHSYHARYLQRISISFYKISKLNLFLLKLLIMCAMENQKSKCEKNTR